ncbi:hypothetical protein N185_08465 [Sinorhizobium sp. GW3]|nr:hypothetical protein N185_08465 [Sinorhizobium sp. GW3]
MYSISKTSTEEIRTKKSAGPLPPVHSIHKQIKDDATERIPTIEKPPVKVAILYAIDVTSKSGATYQQPSS